MNAKETTKRAGLREVPKPSSHPIELCFRWLLAVVLVWAGLSKLVDPVSFYGAILEYRLPLPSLLLKIAAVILPWMELFCGLLLMAGIARRATLLWMTGLFAVFLAIAAQAYLRGLDISCGCFKLGVFGIDERSKLGHFLASPGFATVRNVILLGIAGLLWKPGIPKPPVTQLQPQTVEA